MASLSVKTRMLLLGVVAFAASAIVAVNSTVGMEKMEVLQHAGQDRAREAIQAQEAAGMGPKFYQIIADTVINRNFDDAAGKWSAAKQEGDKLLAALEAAVDTDEEKQLLRESKALAKELAGLYEKDMLSLLHSDGVDLDAVRTLDGKVDTLVGDLEERLVKISHLLMEEAEEADEEFDAMGVVTQRNNVILSLLALSALAAVATWVIRSLLRELGGEPAYAAEIAERIANGDLSGAIVRKTGDERSLLASIARMQVALTELIAGIKDSAAQVSGAAQQLSGAASQVSAASQEQSDSASSMSAAVEEMTVSIGQVADGAAEANRSASHAGELSLGGVKVVGDAVAEIRGIANAVGQTSTLMEKLGAQSEQITVVVNVIREIADQTNLLALNAAIEAARAGEQGRVFAVVADEVRKLAERTSISTTEISSMIASIQHSIVDALDSMHHGSSRVEHGVQLASSASTAITQVQESASQLVSAVADISVALQEQRGASSQIAQGVERIAQMTEESNAATAQVAEAAIHLQELSTSLRQMTERFRVASAHA